MARVKTRVRFDIKKQIDKIMNRKTQRQMGKAIIAAMKESIAAGFSPVKGFRRFRPYAAQRNDAVGDYPLGIKPVRPVNLKLDGEMLKYLTWQRVGKKGIRGISVGIHRNAPRDVRIRAEVHNDGTRSDIPQRKFIPDKTEDEFSVKIQRIRKKILKKRLNDIIKKSNR